MKLKKKVLCFQKKKKKKKKKTMTREIVMWHVALPLKK
jgi:hypothetical protein